MTINASPVEPDTPEPLTAPRLKVAAFFDVDNTIIRGASAFYLARAMYNRGFFRKRDLWVAVFQQAKYNLMGEDNQMITSSRNRALSLIRGHSVAEVVALGEQVYDQVLAHRIYPGTQRLITQHLAAGHEVWLITATPIEIGELIARRLGVSGALATVAEHEGGYYTGNLVGEMMHGPTKANGALRLAKERNIDLTTSFAYGDSLNDVPLLNTVGNPCAINPDARLRKHAKVAGWPTRDFRGKRRTAKSSLKTASWAGLVWAVALVVKRLTQRFRN